MKAEGGLHLDGRACFICWAGGCAARAQTAEETKECATHLGKVATRPDLAALRSADGRIRALPLRHCPERLPNTPAPAVGRKPYATPAHIHLQSSVRTPDPGRARRHIADSATVVHESTAHGLAFTT